METVFKYGHMVTVGDRFDFVDATQVIPVVVPVVVKDAWPSRYCKFTDPRPMWLELWTSDPDSIARPVAVKKVNWFEHMYVTPANMVVTDHLDHPPLSGKYNL